MCGISGENGVQSWPPKESKLAEKTVLGPRHAGSAKSTLWRTSEMTPDGWFTVFSASLDSMGGQDYPPFPPKIPHNGPNSPQKRGNPPFFTVLSCTPINVFLVPAHGPKRCFINPEMGAALIKYGVLGSYWLHKKSIGVQVGRGGLCI